MRISEIQEYTDFISLRDKWNGLLAKSDNTIFSTWEWLSTWWKHFGTKRRLRLLFAEENEQILGIAPLMLSKYRFARLGQYRQIEFIGRQDADYNDFILLDKKEDCMKLFFYHLKHLSDWDNLNLCEINDESPSYNILQNMQARQNMGLKLTESCSCPYITLPTSLEAFTTNLGPNMRKNLQRYMRKLSQEYNVQFKTQHDFGSIKEAMISFFVLHQKRWESKGEPGAFVDKAIRDFNMDIAEIFSQKGWLSLYFLTANNRPIAAAYTFDYNMKKHARLTGFDPDFSNFRVGNLLKMHIIEDCIDRGLKEYNLSRGAGFGKEYWSTGARKNYVVKMYNENLRGKFSAYTSRLLNETFRLHGRP
jgi:CelD/BcsL family acetyltransferase involved in cellulose biosynthesis